jgi:hypothetical protein
MKQRIILLLTLVALIILLIGLNAASYVQQEKLPDSEAQPNRSTFNAGATGTKALHDLLKESGNRVTRWQEPITQSFEAHDPFKMDTFVVIGRVRRAFEEEEIHHLLEWVSAGGQLVIIDREPDQEFLVTTAPWEISINDGKNALSANEKQVLLFSVDPSDESQMTAKTAAAKPVQPTAFTAQINGVQPSKFGNSISIARVAGQEPESMSAEERIAWAGKKAREAELAAEERSASGDDQTDPEAVLPELAPVVHLSNREKDILVDYPFGSGRVVLLSDPYIVANGGIDLVDNAQLAINILTSNGGAIAFDEYHQGFGNDESRLIGYFSGTPVVSIFLQSVALLALVLFSRGRRFARPLPAQEPDRLSKLEYVGAMAQLQSRTKAYDLAVENVYTDFRRRVSRFFGVDNYSVSKESLAAMISRRLGTESHDVLELLEMSEDIKHGVPTRKKQVLRTVKRLREIENALGLKRGSKRSVL